MKVPPISLSNGMDRLPLPLPFSADLIWRYPFLTQPPHGSSGLPAGLQSLPGGLQSLSASLPSLPTGMPSLSASLPSLPVSLPSLSAGIPSLPADLPADPRGWAREDVVQFLSYCQREFDLERIDLQKFQMNGKALCFLSKNDLAERCSGAGDVIHNILQMLLREASVLCSSSQSLVAPTSPSPFSRHPWLLLNSSASETFPNLSHFTSPADSATHSPAPSLDSTSGSPKQDIPHIPRLYLPSQLQIPQSGTSTGPVSSYSDSEDSIIDPQRSPTATAVPALQAPPRTPSPAPSSSSRETDLDVPSTNGRLLWDFLQQLLNDASQRYTSYIAWKNKETRVFKIVDPSGLARLWGIQKNHLSMNYDKMSRALRYYYRVNILRKVQGERHCYQFLRNPTELKSIKNISLLRQQMETQAAAKQLAVQQIAQQAVFASSRSPVKSEIPSPGLQQPLSDEPHDLSVSGRGREDDRERERMERETYYSQLMERYNLERTSPGQQDRQRSEERDEARNYFDYRQLIPQVSIKTE